jgi:hypothetical protein
MGKLISGYLWAYRNVDSGIKSLQSLQKYYPDADLFINVDYEGDLINYQQRGLEIGAKTSINLFQLGYCGNFGNVNVGYECWDREKTFEFIRGFYEACKKTDSYYIMLLEEDDFILKPMTILNYDFSCAIHPTAPSPTGRMRPNPIPKEFFEYSSKLGGATQCPGYASGGGTIFNREQFIESWENCKDQLYEDYDELVRVSKIMGWVDFFLQYIMMIGGYEIIQNPLLCEHWEVPTGWEQFDIITGLKDHTLVTI